MEEYGDFINRRSVFGRDNIWIMAADDHCKANRWNYKYSYQQTKVLGKLACLVLSKILGIGTAERNWKQVKAVKSGQRVNTTIDKTRKQVLVYGQYQQICAQALASKLSSAGKLWDDDDFHTCPRRLLGHRGAWLEERFPNMKEGNEITIKWI